MKFNGSRDKSAPRALGVDTTDCCILELLQENCKQPLAAIGEKVGLSAPAVVERIHKLEEAGIIRGYAAVLDARLLGRDVTAFIGVSTAEPGTIRSLEAAVSAIEEALECHHVTGAHSLMIKVKTCTTETLEGLIDRIRSLPGVSRTETMVVLSTQTERNRIVLADSDAFPARASRQGGRGRRTAK